MLRNKLLLGHLTRLELRNELPPLFLSWSSHARDQITRLAHGTGVAVRSVTLERAIRRAGIAREAGQIGWHDLRHTYGSHLAMRGVPSKVIQELMGHASIEMTMRYAHLSPEMKRDAVQLLDGPLQAWGNRGAMGAAQA